MTEGYYSPHPQLALQQPLVLVGHPGAGVDQIGRMISGRTGLPFNDVERAAESMAGASRSRILMDEGIGRLREFEAAALDKAVRRKPAGIVVMESGLLEDAPRRSWLRARCAVVYVRRPDDVLLALVRQRVARAPGSLPEFLVGPPERVEELREYLAPREGALSEIDVIVEAEGRGPSWVASEIIASLDRLLAVERLGH